MDDVRLGTAIRMIRIRAGLRQIDVAARAGVSRPTVTRIEAGSARDLRLRDVSSVAGALGARLDVRLRWRGGELDRLLDAGHAAMHEAMAATFARLDGWSAVPEVSFAIRGEWGVVDILAWHGARRVLLVVELKTQLIDLSETLGTLDRKRRLAPLVAAQRGWRPSCIATWLVLADTPAARDRVAEHGSVLRAVLPADGRRMRAWLREPDGPIGALTFLTNGRLQNLRPGAKRVTRRRAAGSTAQGRGPSRASSKRRAPGGP